jgi:hypothetical protein
VTPANVESVERIYGFDWASVDSRADGLDELAHVIGPEFESRFSPELGPRVARGLSQLAVFGEALEQDFSEFRYHPDQIESLSDAQVLVSGQIVCTARSSGMPLGGAFSHVWTFRDGRAELVQAFRSVDEARAAVSG